MSVAPGAPAATVPATARPPGVELAGLSKTYVTADGGRVEALAPIDLVVEDRSFVSLVGPSGCGKSTLLRIVAGLEGYGTGRVQVRGRAVDGPRRDFGMVFQQPVLLPWRTVLQNSLLPAEIAGDRSAGIRAMARDLLDLVGLSGFENRYPRELSGGMQQRVALVRALISEPTLLLMDEPFGALDALTRETMNAELLRIWSETAATVLFVTHSVGEAVFLSDTVVVLSGRPGQILEEIPVSLPRPRDFDMMASPEAGRLTGHIRTLLQATGGVG